MKELFAHLRDPWLHSERPSPYRQVLRWLELVGKKSDGDSNRKNSGKSNPISPGRCSPLCRTVSNRARNPACSLIANWPARTKTCRSRRRRCDPAAARRRVRARRSARGSDGDLPRSAARRRTGDCARRSAPRRSTTVRAARSRAGRRPSASASRAHFPRCAAGSGGRRETGRRTLRSGACRS